MKRILLILFLVIVIGLMYAGWNVFGPVVSAPEGKYFYIPTGAKYEEVKKSLKDQKIISGDFFFDKISSRAKFERNIKPGRYEITNGMSLVSLIRMLKGGRQSAVKLVINKLRTKEDLAAKIGNNFEADSTEVMSFITNNDSLGTYGLDTNTVMTTIIPNTYLITWNGSFKKIFTRLKSEHDKFWTEERLDKATALGIKPEEVYTIASIVEEETNKKEDKGLIASVYLNRIKKGMKLEADPTVKYALRNFALKRIYNVHLEYLSPYNTYRNTGIPPGPICTPSATTIDAVLNAPQTDYIFFVAKADLRGYHVFTENYEDHKKFANEYRMAISKKN